MPHCINPKSTRTRYDLLAPSYPHSSTEAGMTLRVGAKLTDRDRRRQRRAGSTIRYISTGHRVARA
eukprot:2705938-Rhodomonas_salina.1